MGDNTEVFMFKTLSPLPEDLIFGIQAAYTADTHPKKVNLGIGAYRDALGNPLVFTAVHAAEEQILKEHLNKEYLPIAGDKKYIDETAKLIFGKESKRWTNGSIFGAQTVGGTNALRIGAEFQKDSVIYIPNLTWTNHKLIFARAGLRVETYPYYNFEQHTFDFAAMCAAIKRMEPGSMIVLHGTSHNPTGLNPTFDQWKTLADLTEHLLPFFDISYQGFGTGVEEDLKPLRYFIEQNRDLLVAYTYAKTMGLYGERVGAFYIATQNPSEAEKVGTHIKQIIRSSYSNPPLHGARIVTTVLQSPELRKEWVDELNSMRDRVNEMRVSFVTEILAKAKNTHFAFMKQGTGLFTFSGITSDQIKQLRERFHIYMPDGRINLAGLNWNNMDYVIESLLAV